ncbi:MAG: FKBP-type peptidyl-prolyl cis-trans isomerase N-terminal domain-containing protein, partial [Candidatus Hydrogenedentes bacterium]|nr:FKBP-type peptidyl-prolyl cis-trans isomerase N-terminal domain-containing protein [Candidatus Hydrogenedentota bacterium]
MCKTWCCGIAIITLCVVGLAYAADEKPAQTPAPGDMSEIQKVSYSVGVQMGTGLKKTKTEFDRALLLHGMQDALDGKNTLLSDADMKQVMMSFQQTMLSKRQEEQKRQAEENKEEQKKFLEENAKKEGVTTLPSGLQYK